MIYLHFTKAWINPRYIVSVRLFYINQFNDKRQSPPANPTWHNVQIPNKPLYQRTETELDVRTKRGEIDVWTPALLLSMHCHEPINVHDAADVARVMSALEKALP